MNNESQTPPKRRGARPKTERNKALAADYDGGMSIPDLAEKYGLKESSVKIMVMQFRRNGLITRQADPRPQRHAERNAEIVRRYEQGGITVRALADEYEMTPVNVSVILRNAAMQRESSTDPFVTVKVRLSDVQRFVNHKRERYAFTLPPVTPILKACEDALSGQ